MTYSRWSEVEYPGRAQFITFLNGRPFSASLMRERSGLIKGDVLREDSMLVMTSLGFWVDSDKTVLFFRKVSSKMLIRHSAFSYR